MAIAINTMVENRWILIELMYLLDTNICIALLKNHPNAVSKFAQHFQVCYLSSIGVAEL